MQRLILLISIHLLYIHAQSSSSSNCITLTNTICGVDAKIKAVKTTFPNSSVFDSTIFRLVNGSDSRKLLSNYTGCTSTNARYSKSFWCGFLSFDQSQKCDSKDNFRLCTSTCLSMIKSMNASFNNEEKCLQSMIYTKKRTLVMNIWKDYCYSSTFKKNCLESIPIEVDNCGFESVTDAKKFCKDSNDNCCSKLSSREEELAQEITQVCEFNDINCWDGLKTGIVVGLSLVVLVLLSIIIGKSKRKPKTCSTSKLIISDPVRSDDHDYTTYIKEYTEPLNHAWYDSDSSNQELSTDSSISTDSSFSLIERDKKSISDLFDRGYKIYSAREDYFPESQSKLTLHKGDQVVIKETLSNELGVGVNLNSTEEGIVSISMLEGLD